MYGFCGVRKMVMRDLRQVKSHLPEWTQKYAERQVSRAEFRHSKALQLPKERQDLKKQMAHRGICELLALKDVIVAFKHYGGA